MRFKRYALFTGAMTLLMSGTAFGYVNMNGDFYDEEIVASSDARFYFDENGKLWEFRKETWGEYTKGKGKTWDSKGNKLILMGLDIDATDNYNVGLEVADNTIIELKENTTSSIKVKAEFYEDWVYKKDGTGMIFSGGEGALAYGISAEGNCTIQGTGSLNISTGGCGAYGIYAVNNLTINGADLNLVNEPGYWYYPSRFFNIGIFATNELNIKSGDIDITIKDAEEIGEYTGEWDSPYGAIYNRGMESDGNMTIKGGDIDINSGNAWSTTGIISFGNLKVSGGTINAVAGDGYDGTWGLILNTLDDTKLNKCTISGGTLNFKSGKNLDKDASSHGIAIFHNEDVVISGGSITATAGSGKYANGINTTAPLTITGGEITVNAGKGKTEYYGIWTNNSIDVSGDAKLIINGNSKATAKAAIYQETDYYKTNIKGNSSVIANGLVKSDNAISVTGKAALQVDGNIQTANGIEVVKNTFTLKGAKEKLGTKIVNKLSKSGSAPISLYCAIPATTVKSADNAKNSIDVTWDEIACATGYYVYRNNKLIATINKGTTTSYADKKASTNGAKYQYKVVAFSGNDKSKASAVKTTYRLTTPTISSAKNSASKAISLSWNKNAKASGYQIKLTVGDTTKTYTVNSASTLSKKLTSLKKGSTYSILLRSFKTVSGKKYYSDWSTVKSCKVAK